MFLCRPIMKGLHMVPNKMSIIVNSSTCAKPQLLHPVLVSIEGNIGSGKSTLLKQLRKRNPEWTFIDEPVATWAQIKNDAGEAILEVFYKDRKRWSYTFQNCALLTRHQYIEAAVQEERNKSVTGKHIFLTERCLDTDFHVFTKLLQAEGSIDSLELDLYLRLLTQLKVSATPLTAIVHVDTPPSECSLRIKNRMRPGEDSISMDYLTALDEKQCSWISGERLPTLVTDATETTDLERVETFIRSLQN